MTNTNLFRTHMLPAILLLAQPMFAHAADQEITYAKHVAPIIQDKCQVCHQPNSIAPVQFMTYQDVLKEAKSIKHKVETRVMPPWHIDTTVGIQHFKNNRGLTDDEIDTIIRWVDAGAPLGDRRDLPPPREYPDPNQWQLAELFGEPDLVIKSEPYTLAAKTQDKWFRPLVDTGVTEPRWVRAIEIKPSYPDGRKIVHHTLAFLEQEEDGITGLASGAEGAQTKLRTVHGMGRRQGRRNLRAGCRQADAPGLENSLGSPHARHRQKKLSTTRSS